MRSIAFGEGESSGEILCDHFVLDVFGKSIIDFLLEGLSGVEVLVFGAFSAKNL